MKIGPYELTLHTLHVPSPNSASERMFARARTQHDSDCWNRYIHCVGGVADRRDRRHSAGNALGGDPFSFTIDAAVRRFFVAGATELRRAIRIGQRLCQIMRAGGMPRGQRAGLPFDHSPDDWIS